MGRFFKVAIKQAKKGVLEVYPDFQVDMVDDLMTRGGSFYAVWRDDISMWSTNEYDVKKIVDDEIRNYCERHQGESEEVLYSPKYMTSYSSYSWKMFRDYVKHLPDHYIQLDNKLTFSNTEVKKKDYVSKRLPYPLEPGDYSAWDELVGTLYSPEEREKIEWAIGAVVSGDARSIQKFIVLYGEAGAGKSTILNVIQKLFEGYYTTFEAKALTSTSNAFSTEVFKSNPLVGIQHDGDLSRIEDNTKLNSIVSHEEMTMNEKYKSSYMSKVNCFLFMATNRPVKITDAKSGIIRRLISVEPTGKKIPPKRYQALMNQINFELGAIAYHCLEEYKRMGKNYYAQYKPLDMIFKTDVFFNFVEDSYPVFEKEDGVTLKAAYAMYKDYCDGGGSDFKMPMYKFREELKNYFKEFEQVSRIDGKQVRSYYSGFMKEKFVENYTPVKEEKQYALVLDKTESLLDIMLEDQPAQYATSEGIPRSKWANVKTTLKDISTDKLHYVLMPENHIVIDFDIEDENGNKSMEKNLEAASKWPPTYAEFSKGGAGIHLHYIYDGDASKLSSVYDKDIEIKVFTGNASLRRKLTLCNNIPVSAISSGLPIKEETNDIREKRIQSEKSLRKLIQRNLDKEIMPGTKPSIDFIDKILKDAEASGLHYDIRDMRQKVLLFAMNSTHHSDYCVKVVKQMKFCSDEPSQPGEFKPEDPIIFFDCEVFPNLFLVNWKEEGDHEVVRMINPSPIDIEKLMEKKLVGFNCRRYDNHILYARMLGYSNIELYELSKKIIAGEKDCFFAEAYNVSYTDVYDYSSKKQSLKKFEIELGHTHKELGMDWNKPVPEELWEKVAEYCDNDVLATEATHNARKGDFEARLILVDLANMLAPAFKSVPNDTTNMLTGRIIFGNERHPQGQFIYTDLSNEFHGYEFRNGKSHYRGEEIGEGGYVYSEPGYYENVDTEDVAGMHPSSAFALNLFGDEYTARYKMLYDLRICIKHKDWETAKSMFDGKLSRYLEDENQAKMLSNALKIAINSVYGLTSAKFDNLFRDRRNIDNIVAKRGELFMINLKHEVQARGFTVAHIKTDSIKVPGMTDELRQFIRDYGKQYGYTFETEAVYEKFCLVNDAVYIAKEKDGGWTATGAQFAEPYVFKSLFSKEPIVFNDLCQTKSVSTALYLDMNEGLPEGEHDYSFVGRVGRFCPMKPGAGGGLLVREKDGKFYSATGAKGYRWLEAEDVRARGLEDEIDIGYFEKLAEQAKKDISQYVDFEEFVGERYSSPPCGLHDKCADCPEYVPATGEYVAKCNLGYLKGE